MRGRTLVAAMCFGQIGTLLPHAAFPALIPLFTSLWSLSNTEAGWIAGAYFFGYMCMVPVTSALTDRRDARGILAVGAVVCALATMAFALLADGLISALLLWGIAGAGLAGAYMPGLKALSDRLEASEASRSITLYTASYSVGVGLSFLVTQTLADLIGWRATFMVVGCGPLLMLAVALRLAARQPTSSTTRGFLFDFRPVLRNRAAIGYILGYGAHCFELAGLRAWLVAFWTFAVVHYGSAAMVGATAVSVMVTVLGMPASIFGNEMALRFGRRRAITTVMLVSAAIALAIGGATTVAPWALLPLILLYALSISADSGALTSGMMAAADPALKGATMALHSTLGFATSCLGPIFLGIALDTFGGVGNPQAWQAAFAILAVSILCGPLLLWWSRRGGTQAA